MINNDNNNIETGYFIVAVEEKRWRKKFLLFVIPDCFCIINFFKHK